MTPRETVQSRRTAILAAATDEMHRAQHRRVRNARIATAVLVASIGAIAAMLVRPPSARGPEHGNLAIDFASIDAGTPTIDFEIVTHTEVPLLDTLTDSEAEAALRESGYCVKIMRVANQVRLVDCTTGAPSTIR